MEKKTLLRLVRSSAGFVMFARVRKTGGIVRIVRFCTTWAHAALVAQEPPLSTNDGPERGSRPACVSSCISPTIDGWFPERGRDVSFTMARRWVSPLRVVVRERVTTPATTPDRALPTARTSGDREQARMQRGDSAGEICDNPITVQAEPTVALQLMFKCDQEAAACTADASPKSFDPKKQNPADRSRGPAQAAAVAK